MVLGMHFFFRFLFCLGDFKAFFSGKRNDLPYLRQPLGKIVEDFWGGIVKHFSFFIVLMIIE